MTLHNALTGAELHEPKNISTATGGAADIGKVIAAKGDGTSEVRRLATTELDSGAAVDRQILAADGSGGVTMQVPTRMGMWDYNDVATITTPIALVVADTGYPLTNDGLGPNTNLLYALPELSNIWNVATDKFDYTMLALGDTVDIRVDVEVTTTGANHEVAMFWQFGIGGTPYELQIIRQNFKIAGTYTFTVLHSAYMGDLNTRDNPSVVLMASDSTGDSVVVNGWFVRTVTRSDF